MNELPRELSLALLSVAFPADGHPMGSYPGRAIALCRYMCAGYRDACVRLRDRGTLPSRSDVEAELGEVLPDVDGIPDRIMREAEKLAEEIEGRIGPPASAKPKRGPVIRTLDTVEPLEFEWLWPRFVPRGTLTIIEGDPGLGKSTCALDLAARVTTGEAMPDGQRPSGDQRRGVVVLSAEDDAARTIRPRLDAAGADCSRIALLDGVVEDEERMPNVGDLDAIRVSVQRVDAALIIVDPLTAFMGPGADTHRDADVRARLAPLLRLCGDLGVALLVVRHLKKSTAETSPTYRGGGSIGIVGAARSAILVARDPNDESRTRLLFAPHKSNVSKLAPPMAFRVVPEGSATRIEWEGPDDSTDAGELLRAQARSGSNHDEPSCLDEARSFLTTTLASGAVPTTTVLREARGQGVAEKTARRAARALGVVAERGAKCWTWRLPGPADPGDAYEPGDGREHGQAKMANPPVGTRPPCNSATQHENGAPAVEYGQAGASGHDRANGEEETGDAEPI